MTVDQGKVLLRSFSGTIMLSGEFVSTELPALLPQLDGRKTVQEITDKIREDFRPELEKFLSLMTEKGLLCDGELLAGESGSENSSEANSHDKAYWSLAGTTANEALSRLRSSTVMVVNLGGVGASIARSLAAAGVGKIVAIDPHRVSRSDETFGYDARDLGKTRVDAVASYVARLKSRDFVPIDARISELSNWEQLVSEADLVVIASENMSLKGYRQINDSCIRHKINWLSARIDRNRGIIGPFVVPEQSACFECFELRNRANSEHPTDHEAIYQHWKETDNAPQDWPTNVPFVSIVGNYVALDIQRVLGGHHLSAILGRVLYIDLHTFESRFHEILKLPRCPACSRGRQRPLTRIWDLRSSPDSHASGN